MSFKTDSLTTNYSAFELTNALVRDFLKVHDIDSVDISYEERAKSTRLTASIKGELRTREVSAVQGNHEANLSLLESLVLTLLSSSSELFGGLEIEAIKEDRCDVDEIRSKSNGVVKVKDKGLEKPSIITDVSGADHKIESNVSESYEIDDLNLNLQQRQPYHESLTARNANNKKCKELNEFNDEVSIEPLHNCDSPNVESNITRSEKEVHQDLETQRKNKRRSSPVIPAKLNNDLINREGLDYTPGDGVMSPTQNTVQHQSPLASPYSNTRRFPTPHRPQTALVIRRERVNLLRRASTPNQRTRAAFVSSEPIRKIREKLSFNEERKRCSSRESWIPENIRRKMVQREFSVAKINYQYREKFRLKQKNQHKFEPSTLERSKSKEKYGIAQRKPCGLCNRTFLPENLVLAVTLKAILDLRETWGTKYDPDSAAIKINPNLKRAPLCYNETRVCVFCAQLFDNQEMYRPSWKAKQAERRRTQIEQDELMQKISDDPLVQSQQCIDRIR